MYEIAHNSNTDMIMYENASNSNSQNYVVCGSYFKLDSIFMFVGFRI